METENQAEIIKKDDKQVEILQAIWLLRGVLLGPSGVVAGMDEKFKNTLLEHIATIERLIEQKNYSEVPSILGTLHNILKQPEIKTELDESTQENLLKYIVLLEEKL